MRAQMYTYPSHKHAHMHTRTDTRTLMGPRTSQQTQVAASGTSTHLHRPVPCAPFVSQERAAAPSSGPHQPPNSLGLQAAASGGGPAQSQSQEGGSTSSSSESSKEDEEKEEEEGEEEGSELHPQQRSGRAHAPTSTSDERGSTAAAHEERLLLRQLVEVHVEAVARWAPAQCSPHPRRCAAQSGRLWSLRARTRVAHAARTKVQELAGSCCGGKLGVGRAVVGLCEHIASVLRLVLPLPAYHTLQPYNAFPITLLCAYVAFHTPSDDEATRCLQPFLRCLPDARPFRSTRAYQPQAMMKPPKTRNLSFGALLAHILCRAHMLTKPLYGLSARNPLWLPLTKAFPHCPTTTPAVIGLSLQTQARCLQAFISTAQGWVRKGNSAASPPAGHTAGEASGGRCLRTCLHSVMRPACVGRCSSP